MLRSCRFFLTGRFAVRVASLNETPFACSGSWTPRLSSCLELTVPSCSHAQSKKLSTSRVLSFSWFRWSQEHPVPDQPATEPPPRPAERLAQALRAIEKWRAIGSEGLAKGATLQAEAFWQQHSAATTAVVWGTLSLTAWHEMSWLGSSLLGHSLQPATECCLMLLSSSGAALGLEALRRHLQADPLLVFHQAMRKLADHPALVEVLGRPLVGSDMRASVVTGGGLGWRGSRPVLRSQVVHLVFPLQGSERRGLVSLEAKKLRGRYLFKLLAVDVPTGTPGDIREERIFLVGASEGYHRGHVLQELREPFIKALCMREAYEEEDEADEAAMAVSSPRLRSRIMQAASDAIAAAIPPPKPSQPPAAANSPAEIPSAMDGPKVPREDATGEVPRGGDAPKSAR